MSKKKRRRKEERINNEGYNGRVNNNPFGINPAQLMNMLGGNLDMSQIGNLLSSMKGDGLDLNNFNIGNFAGDNQGGTPMHNNRNGFDLGALQGLMNNLGVGGFNLQNNNIKGSNRDNKDNLNIAKENEYGKKDQEDDLLEDDNDENDENIQMLIAIKSIVDFKKADFIDKVIEAYKNGYFNGE